jgi:3-keto-5-aminohexanoate cleavage enzyme
MDTSWDYADAREYIKHIEIGMPPLIITAAVTGDHQKSENPNVPVTAEEQAADAAAVSEAGARVVHIHGRQSEDPTKGASDAARYREINDLIREKAPSVLIDNTQTGARIAVPEGELIGSVWRYKSAPIDAGPDIMALNPGPMTFRGKSGAPATASVATFDDTVRAADTLRERGIKPQVFLYHPGHLDIMEYLIEHDALDKPYFVQLVFGQQSGISTGLDSFLYMVRNLPPDCIFQACALGLEAVHVNTLSILVGGHVRTGMEDSLLFRCDEPAQSNVQLVHRIARIAQDLGRRVATPEETRQMLGIKPLA